MSSDNCLFVILHVTLEYVIVLQLMRDIQVGIFVVILLFSTPIFGETHVILLGPSPPFPTLLPYSAPPLIIT